MHFDFFFYSIYVKTFCNLATTRASVHIINAGKHKIFTGQEFLWNLISCKIIRERNKTIAYADALSWNGNLICQNLDVVKYNFFFIFVNSKLCLATNQNLVTNEIFRIWNLLTYISQPNWLFINSWEPTYGSVLKKTMNGLFVFFNCKKIYFCHRLLARNRRFLFLTAVLKWWAIWHTLFSQLNAGSQ